MKESPSRESHTETHASTAKASTALHAILWDLDGVLIDSEPGYYITIGNMMRSLGYPYGKKEAAKIAGTSFKNTAELLALDVPPHKVQQLYVQALMQGVQQHVTGLIPGAAQFLESLNAKGVMLALGSSSPKQLVDYVVEKYGLATWLSAIVTGDDAANGKPSPEIYLKCAALLRTPPAQCLVIEDSLNGIRSAKNAGMKVCAFTGTNHQKVDLSSADFSIDSYTNKTLATVLQKMGL